MEILVLEHERDAPAGLLEEWARERGHALRVLEVPGLRQWPAPTLADAVVSLGCERSVHAAPPRWVAGELELLALAHADNVPVLGICFGAQALAVALGGQVRRADHLTVEWSLLDTHEQELIPQGPWLRWHEDVFTVPPGARELASAEDVTLAFAAGRSIGVQFHPEADAAIASAWIAGSRHTLRDRARELQAVKCMMALDAHAARERALALFDTIAAYWAA